MELTMLQIIFVSGLVAFAFQKFQEPKMIFAFWGKLLKRMSKSKLGEKLAKPLGACIVCNSTWIGFLIAWLAGKDIISILIIGVASSAVAILINTVHMYLIENMD